jgi:hypothetical protein
MASKTKAMRQQEERIKQKIVDTYKRGMCDHNGGWIPPAKRGTAGKGSHYIAPITDRAEYRRNYNAIDWSRR